MSYSEYRIMYKLLEVSLILYIEQFIGLKWLEIDDGPPKAVLYDKNNR